MTIPALWLLTDLLLVALALGITLATVLTASMQRAIILFMALGLVLALIWARLKAPDLALAEAAIGAGITGALLLAAQRDTPLSHLCDNMPTWHKGVIIGLGSLLMGLMTWALWPVITVPQPASVTLPVNAALEASGVSNPVTAVLLNFRAYDTLLELLVLLAAALGIVALGPGRPATDTSDPVLKNLLGVLVPLLVLMAGYLLWRGAHAPGGAFQAGAILAAAGILLHLAGIHRALRPMLRRLNALVCLGCLVFILVGLGGFVLGEGFLQYRTTLAAILILVIEAAAMLSIAAILVVAYIGGTPTQPALSPNPASKEDTP